MPSITMRLSLLVTFALLAVPAHAQLTVVIPNGTATVAGNTSNAFPWGASASGWPGLRLMCVYDSTNLINQGITFPVLITRLRWRPNDGAGAYTGGTFQQATVELSTAPIDWSQVTTNYASNHGADRTVVYTGPVTHVAGSGGTIGIPASWNVDVPLTTPFSYDPSLGDLVIDCDYPGGANFVGGSLPQMDVHGTGSQSARIFASSMYPTANGTTQNHGVVVEVTYIPAAGAALATPFGDGCYDAATATFYETFPASTFDLSNTGITMIPTGTGYAVVPIAGAWFTPTSTPIALTDNALTSPLALGFTLPFPGGSTTAVLASSNGFVWAQTSATNNGCCGGDPGALRFLGPRWCPLWTDLNPATAGGSVRFDPDPVNSAAYLTFTNVAEAGSTNTCTFQVAFFATGQVEFRFQACSVVGHTTLCGWSPGNGASDPGSIDLSTTLPIVTSPDLHALRLAAGTRPIVGTNVTLTASRVPTGSPLGAFLGGVTQHVPGLPLAPIGMAGCFQHISLDATRVFLPTGTTGSMVFAVPNVPALSGTHLFWQAAAFASGMNPLGVISSNGLDLLIGTQ